ncbi:MAG TPA: response regulator transcription factor [Candidatus Dormibacteraeota bacterium]|jgi:two-component system response regulator RegX3|nr:response regulator transcription factor [Candidatus Dormibacteraeota bacterium]
MTISRRASPRNGETAAGPAPILVVEDEPALAESIQYSLEREGFRVVVALDGERGVELFRTEEPALVLLDLMLPKLSGLDVCRIVRDSSTVPILILTAKDSEADKVTGLELGADDYITKPFSMRELISRVRANRRRAQMIAGSSDVEILRGGPVELDDRKHEVSVRGQRVAMTPKEFELLRTFLTGMGRLRTRSYLISEVWGNDYFGDTKTLDVHVKRLRQKLERDPHNPEYLVTVRGLGYRFLDEPPTTSVPLTLAAEAVR